MLYTVMPLERIYTCRTESILKNSNHFDDITSASTAEEYKNIALPHGRIYARRDGDNYIVDGINSTDMSDYLNSNYVLGSIIK